ncbi:hypothetical protein DPMN_042135 [Dreissena polymorpha]|uniref:Uncharacterized protein n=1 Tax=Dreissena polymorpha TaxID=45954 RepID=A0A9D4CZW5_DREPO|nr:hypothetical protein DPMN_042135 [Dreissena polymorpha]
MSPCAFQNIIESEIREAAANKQYDIRLKLSHFYITDSNMRDLNLILSTNLSNDQSLKFSFGTSSSSLAVHEPTSHFECNLSSCHKLKSLHRWGKHTRLTGNGVKYTIYQTYN